MSAPMEIPGYYYDPTKKKYFKIQKSGATPSDSPYSAANVKRLKLEEDVARKAREVAVLRKDLVKRASVLEDVLIGGRLRREMGRQMYDVAVADVSAKARKAIVEGWTEDIIMEPRLHESDSIGVFAYDEVAREMFVTRSQSTCWSIQEDHYFKSLLRSARESAPKRRSSISDPAPKFKWKDSVMMGAQAYPITSITISKHSRLALTTWSSSVYQLSKLAEKNRSDGFSAANISQSIFYGTQTQIANEEIECSLALPESSPYLFAIGSSHAITLVPRDNFSQHQGIIDSKAGSIFALEYLSQSPSVLLAGTRNGSVQIKDLREKARNGNAASMYPSNLLIHPSTVTHIRQISEHRIVVAGLESSLNQYDLRFTPAATWASPADESFSLSIPIRSSSDRPGTHTTSSGNRNISPAANASGYRRNTSRPNKRDKRAVKPKPATTPFLTYKGYHNAALVKIGFDIDLDTGIIAAAQDDRTVKIYDVHSGDEICSPAMAAPSLSPHEKRTGKNSNGVMRGGNNGGRQKQDWQAKILPDVIKALKFVDDRYGGDEIGAKSLYIACGMEMRRYAW